MSSNEASLALQTIDAVLATLREQRDRDPEVETLIRAMEDDRAFLLAHVVSGSRRQPPSRFRPHDPI